MKGMEEKMLKKKNEFFVIFGMLALCAMLVSACEDEGGGGDNNNPPAEPTSKELAEAAIASMSTLEVGTVSLPGGSLSFTLTGGTKGVTVALSKLTIDGTAVGTLASSDKATASLLTLSTNTLVLAGTGEFDDEAAVVATLGFSVKAGTETVEGSKSLTLPAASIASVAPAISALRQVKADLAGAGSATITEGGTAAVLLSPYTEADTISLDVVTLSGGDSYTVDPSGFEHGTEWKSSFEGGALAIGTLASNVKVLGIKDDEYYDGTASTTYGGSSGTYTSLTNYESGSFSGQFMPIDSGSVSVTFTGLVLNADGLIYNAPDFTATVYTIRSHGEAGTYAVSDKVTEDETPEVVDVD
jgi:hypothetical protein